MVRAVQMHVEVMHVEVLGVGLGAVDVCPIFENEQSWKCRNCGLQLGLL